MKDFIYLQKTYNYIVAYITKYKFKTGNTLWSSQQTPEKWNGQRKGHEKVHRNRDRVPRGVLRILGQTAARAPAGPVHLCYWTIRATNRVTALDHAHLYIPSVQDSSYILLSRSKTRADRLFPPKLKNLAVGPPFRLRRPATPRFIPPAFFYTLATSAIRYSRRFERYSRFSRGFPNAGISVTVCPGVVANASPDSP